MSEQETQPWLRQRGESKAAYAAFKCFLNLGIERTVVAAFRQKTGKEKAKQAAGVWNRWVKDWNWHSRSRASDEFVELQNLIALERTAQQEAAQWMARREQQRQTEWDCAQRLIERADAILSWPLSVREETQDVEGNVIAVTIRPVGWKFRDAIAMIDLATKLSHSALDAEPEIPRELLELISTDLDKLTDEQLVEHEQKLKSILQSLLRRSWT